MSDHPTAIELMKPAGTLVGSEPIEVSRGRRTTPDAIVARGVASGFGIQTATVHVTSAQLKALSTVPIQIVAAPGAGKAILPLGINFSYTHLTADYTGGTAADLYYGAVGNATAVGASSALVAALQGAANNFGAVAPVVSGTIAHVDNQALNLVSTADLAAGSGTLVITVPYIIVPTA